MKKIIIILMIICMINIVSAEESFTWHDLNFDNFELDNKTIDKGSGVIKYGIFADDFDYPNGETGDWLSSPQYRNGYMYPIGGSSYISSVYPVPVNPETNFSVYSEILANGRPHIGFGGSGYSSITSGGAFPGEYWQLNDGYDGISKLGNVGSGRPSSGEWFTVRLDVTPYNDTLNNVTMYGNDNYITYGYTSRNADYWAAKQYGGSNSSARDNFRAYNTDATTGTIITDIRDSYISGYPNKVKLFLNNSGATFSERILIKSSPDNVSWSSWNEVTPNAINNTAYDIPLINQERYYQLRIDGETSNVHTTNKITDIQVEQRLDESEISLEFISVSPTQTEFPLFTGENQLFETQVSKTSTFEWIINNEIVQTDTGTMTSSYTLNEDIEDIYDIELKVTAMGETINKTWSVDIVKSPEGTITWDDFDKTIRVENSSSINLKQIYLYLNNDEAIRLNGTAYELRKLVIYNSTLNIEDVDEVRLMGGRMSHGAGYTVFTSDSDSIVKIRNSNISSFNVDTLTYDRYVGDIILNDADVQDTSFYNTAIIFRGLNNDIKNINTDKVTKLFFEGISNRTFENINMKDSYGGGGGHALYWDEDCNNNTINNIHSDTVLTFSSNMGMRGDNNTITNITLLNAGDYINNRTPATGTYNIKVGGSGNYYENIYLNYARWSSISGGGTGSYWKNVTVLNSGHNALDIRGSNHYFDGFYTNQTDDREVLWTTGYDYNPLFENFTIKNFDVGTGTIYWTNNVSDMLMMDGVSKGAIMGWSGEFVPDGENYVRVINVTAPSFKFWGYENRASHGGAVIDSSFTSLTRYMPSTPYYEEMVCFGNVYYETLDNTYGYKNMSIGYYPNVRVFNETGYPVENAKVTFASDINTIPVWNALGYKANEFYTDANGDLVNENRSSTPILSHIWYDLNETPHYPTWNATVTKDGQTSTIENIEPNSSWLSTAQYDTNAPMQSTSMNVVGSSLQIMDYTPSTSPITTDNSQMFSIEINMDSTITWYVNSIEQKSTNGIFDTFTFSENSGEYEVTATATDGVNSVSQSWNLTIEDSDSKTTYSSSSSSTSTTTEDPLTSNVEYEESNNMIEKVKQSNYTPIIALLIIIGLCGFLIYRKD